MLWLCSFLINFCVFINGFKVVGDGGKGRRLFGSEAEEPAADQTVAEKIEYPVLELAVKVDEDVAA